MSPTTIWRIQLIGWILFVLSAILFTVTTALAGDWIGVTASLLFLLACVVFMVPILNSKSKLGESP